MGIQQEKGLTFAWIERKTSVLKPALQLNQSSLGSLYGSRDQIGGGVDDQVIRIKKAADGRRQRSRKIIDEKRAKNRAKNGSLEDNFMDSERLL